MRTQNHTSFLFYLLLLLLAGEGCGDPESSESAPYAVLTDFSPRIAIHNITLTVPLRTSSAACLGDALLIFLSDSPAPIASDTETSTHSSVSGEEAVEVAFEVRELVMGPGAGRAIVMVDEETIGECPAQHCRVSLSLTRFLQRGRGRQDPATRARLPPSPPSPHIPLTPLVHHIQITLMAAESDMPRGPPVVLGMCVCIYI